MKERRTSSGHRVEVVRLQREHQRFRVSVRLLEPLRAVRIDGRGGSSIACMLRGKRNACEERGADARAARAPGASTASVCVPHDARTGNVPLRARPPRTLAGRMSTAGGVGRQAG